MYFNRSRLISSLRRTYLVELSTKRSTNAGIREVYVCLCGQIGKPIEKPLLSSLKFVLEQGVSPKDVELAAAASILSKELSNIDRFKDRLATDEFYTKWELGQIDIRCD